MADTQLHPESRAFVELTTGPGGQSLSEMTYEEARAQSTLMSLKVNEGANYHYHGTRTEKFVQIPGSSESIPVYIYKPEGTSSNPPILIFYHGGGFVIGCRESVETTCQMISSEAKCVVVNVEYRLAPEHKFPIPFDDCCLVARWVLDNKAALGGSERSKVGVAGDSAGGSLAASVAHDVPGLAFQILVYPKLNAFGDYSLKSYKDYKNGPALTVDLLEWFGNSAAEPADFNNPRLASNLRPNFNNLPPTLFILAECDPIRDDSYEYSKKLTKAGVPNEIELSKGAIHLFYTLPGIFKELTRPAYAKTVSFIHRWS